MMTSIYYSRCRGQGSGTAILEANMVKKMVVVKGTLLFHIFSDLWKSYDALYRGGGGGGSWVYLRGVGSVPRYWVLLGNN